MTMKGAFIDNLTRHDTMLRWQSIATFICNRAYEIVKKKKKQQHHHITAYQQSRKLIPS